MPYAPQGVKGPDDDDITLCTIIRRYSISQMIMKKFPALCPGKSGVNKKDV
jgi:hypothetical protein